MRPAELVGDKDAADFAVMLFAWRPDIDVVGPLDLNATRGSELVSLREPNATRGSELVVLGNGDQEIQGVGYGECDGHRQRVLVGGAKESGFEDEAECEVLAGLAGPVVTLLPDACRLAACAYNRKLLDGVEVEELAVVVGGFERVEPPYVENAVVQVVILNYTVIISFSLAA